MKCNNERCQKDAVLQCDHNGKLIFYCENCFAEFVAILLSIGSFAPTPYPIGTEIYK